MRYCSIWLAFLPVLSGCAAFAVQPATPARYLDLRALDEPKACEHYYVIVFSSENALKQPRFTHTWVTGVRIIDRGPGQARLIEQHTISWMPAALEIDPLRFTLEPGINLDLHTTITRVALANEERIAMWGPYECRPSLYARLRTQKQFMESGKMQYQCVDSVGEAGRTGKGCNCVHAVTDMDPEHGRRLNVQTRYGISAGRDIARRLRELNTLVNPERTHDFLIPVLGLQAYPILRANTDEVFAPSRTPWFGKR